MPAPRILIVDDHTMFRSAMSLLLSSRIGGAQILEAGSLDEALALQQGGPDVVLLDIALPGADGMTGIGLIHAQWPEVPVLMLSAHDGMDTVRQALERGAAGFVSKAESPERIVALLEELLPGSAVPAMTDEVRLTPRQADVLELLGQGLSNKMIARRLDLSENTVRWHVQAILEILQASSRAEAAYLARTMGLIA